MGLTVLITTALGLEKAELTLAQHGISEFILCDIDPDIHEFSKSLSEDIPNVKISGIQIPRADSSGYIEFMEKICGDVDLILPIDTLECIKLGNSSLKDKIGTSTNLSEDIHLNKSDYFKLLNEPEPFILTEDKSHSDFRDYYESHPNFRQFIMKPNNSNGSRGIRVIDLDYHWKDHSNSKCAYYISLRTFNTEILGSSDLIVQPFYGGQNYNIDSYKDSSGNYHHVVHEIKGDPWGQVQRSIILESGHRVRTKVIDRVEQIAEKLDLDRNFNMELKFHLGELYLVEVNPRISAVFPQSIGNDVDLLKVTISDIVNKTTSKSAKQSRVKHKSILLTVKYD